jgi:hypothetical protein
MYPAIWFFANAIAASNVSVATMQAFADCQNDQVQAAHAPPVPIYMADGISGDGALIIKADPTKTGVPIRLLEATRRVGAIPELSGLRPFLELNQTSNWSH